MVLVLEGARKTGKSTFAEALKKHATEEGKQVIVIYDRKLQSLEVDQKTANYISCTQLIAAAKSIEDSLGKDNVYVIFDRFHISELVFGKGYRGYENLGMYKIDNILANEKAKLLLFESNTNLQRMQIGENPFAEEFRKHFKESCLMDKAIINLDIAKGAITTETVKQILNEIGV